MGKLTDLKFLFRAVAVLEAFYAITAFALPPRLVADVTGWILSPDGHWIVKLLGCALATQAYLAWSLRDNPNRSVAITFVLYQLGSATADWLCWLFVPGVFSNEIARIGVVAAIVTHYALGFLLITASLSRFKPGQEATSANLSI